MHPFRLDSEALVLLQGWGKVAVFIDALWLI